MSEIMNPEVTAKTAELSNLQQLVAIMQKVLPLVYGVTHKLRWVMIIGVSVLAWLAIWLLVIKQIHWVTALVVVGIAAIPVLIIARFWWGFEELKGLPAIINGMVANAKSEVMETVQEIGKGEFKKVGFLGSAKGLWSIGSMLGDARGLLGSYVSIATLVNPFSLFLGVLSILAIGVLLLISIVLAFFAF